jgi:multiple sugar transport system substrate-binding protein
VSTVDANGGGKERRMTAHLDRDMEGLSRRTFLQGTLATAGLGVAASALSACGSPAAAGLVGAPLDPQTLTFWNLFGGGDGVRLQVMLDQYAQQHGGAASLQAATFAWGNPYYTKVSLATLGSKPPDVAVSHLTRAQNLAQANLLTPITDDMLASVGLKSTDFNPKVWEAQKLNGKSWVIPLDTHPFVMFYHSGICQKAGLLDADGKLKPIQGTQAWESALAAIQKVTGAYGVASANVGDFATPWRLFQTLYSQQNGATPFISEGGTKWTVNEDLATKTLEYIQKLSKANLLAPTADYAGAQTLMFTGKAGFYLEGPWEITTAQGIKDLKFGIVPIPQIFDKVATQADSHTFVLPRMDRTQEQMTRAMGFMKAMLEQSMTWAKGGHIPAYLPTLNSSEYKALTPQSDYASAANAAVYDSPAWYSGSGSTFENIVGAQIGLVQQGLASPAGGFSAMRSQLDTYLNTPSPL